MKPTTVVKAELAPANLSLHNTLFDSYLDISIHAQYGDRSYEDRDVFFTVGEERHWLKAEQALELGKHLIEQGSKAFEMNMTVHQLIHHKNQLDRFFREGRILKVIMLMINDKPAYHGDGFKTFNIRPVWMDGMAPEFEEDFSFEEVIYFSPFPEEYEKQLAQYAGGLVTFLNYDHAEEVKAFNQSLKEFESESAGFSMGCDLGTGMDYTVVDGKPVQNESEEKK